MRVTIDAVGIREGGGASILTELLRWLPIIRPQWQWDVYLLDRRLRSFDDPDVPNQVSLCPTSVGNTVLGRFWWVYQQLPRLLYKQGTDVLLSFANIGSVRPVVPQVIYCQQLLAFTDTGNASRSFFRRVRLRLLQRAIRRGLPASSAVIVQTKGMREEVMARFPALATKLHIIPSGFRTPSPQPSVRPEVAVMIERAPRPRIAYISLLLPHKNHVALVKAMALLVEAHPFASLLLTIDLQLSTKHEQTRRSVDEHIERLRISDHVICTGQITADEVDYLLRQADILVFPSLAESFGLPLAEAMAAGCPIAAADRAYAREVAGDAAVYFDPTDESAIASCLAGILRDADRMAQLKEGALRRQYIFSYKRIAEQIARVLEKSADASSEEKAYRRKNDVCTAREHAIDVE
jgi:glycosyltransferase involved in cell wall biosynthesis